MTKRQPDIYVVAVVFLAVLGCFTTLTIIGSDGTELLRTVMLPLVGTLGTVAAPAVVDHLKKPKDDDDDVPSS